MMGRLIAMLIVGVLAAPLLAACGGSGTPRTSNGAAASSTAAGASDEAYLTVICGGTDTFYQAVQTSTTAEGITKAVQSFISRLEAITPPSDLRQFNQEFINYLKDAVNDPTSLLSTNPPLPPKKALDRLVSKESSVDPCKKPTFLDVANTPGPAATPTP